MKKLLPALLLGVVTVSASYASQDCAENFNTISYSTQAQTTIKSDSILVQVTGYATTTLKDQNSVEKDIAKKANDIVKADWKVKNLDQNTNNSGTLNITVQLEARISKTELTTLQSALQKQKSYSQKLEVKVLDYNAPASDIEKAKQDLMIHIFNNTKNYLNDFNKKTGSKYIIQKMRYNDTSSYSAQNNKVMLMRTASYDTANASTGTMDISQDIKMNANVTLIER
ncbi:hypothetical protein FLM55_00340 [Francisella sp. Scap27]|uniref:hypothetical protein n=1 Tax=Francisella sp. Scap27 TaxID=2589986 RepID=UPI0015B7B14F|nr:hypothetical protein [Francisella sp. Scap27]QLE78267.1 hypothetical protein FLM55_00340 [Francisella sp. Scap27]